MVVLLILGILAAAIVPNVVGKTEGAKRTKAESDIAVIEGLLDHFYLDMGRYPTTEEGLGSLLSAGAGQRQMERTLLQEAHRQRPVGQSLCL